jgi:hypothetical protein
MKRELRFLAAMILCLAAAMTTSMAVGRPAFEAMMEVEQDLLEQDLQKMRDLSSERTQVELQLQSLYRTMEALLGSTRAREIAQAGIAFQQVEGLEAERRLIFASQKAVVEKIIDRRRKLALMEEKLDTYGDRETGPSPLTGTWQVVMMPKEQSGTFTLIQTGTLVSGTYSLEGGWNGSLQGTLVNRKVYLVRIDSRLGRCMEFEGTLSADESTISGVWLNYDLGAQGGAQGQWSAVHVDREE